MPPFRALYNWEHTAYLSRRNITTILIRRRVAFHQSQQTASNICPKAPSFDALHKGARCYTGIKSPDISPENLIRNSGGSLAGKKAIITGASRGIGAAIARRFSQEGATCILVGRDEEKLLDVKRGLGKGGHEIKIGDVGSEQLWLDLREMIGKEIHILVNAAGVTHFSPLSKTTTAQLEEVVKTNLIGSMLGCKFITRAMMRNRRGGCIINVASLLGLKGGSGSAGYAASKAGVIGLTRALAAEVGKFNVRVNVIVPGYIETDMTEAMAPAARSAAIDAIPLKRFGQTSEIAESAVFLAVNRYASNCILNIDGGLSAM